LHRLAHSDRLLLCTDGLTELVSDTEIAERLSAHPRPDDACRALVDRALEHGGLDNVTVVLAA
jgi:protein phosphatase